LILHKTVYYFPLPFRAFAELSLFGDNY